LLFGTESVTADSTPAVVASFLFEVADEDEDIDRCLCLEDPLLLLLMLDEEDAARDGADVVFDEVALDEEVELELELEPVLSSPLRLNGIDSEAKFIPSSSSSSTTSSLLSTYTRFLQQQNQRLCISLSLSFPLSI